MNWTEIFRAGTHTAGDGTTREWTAAEVEQIARDYDPAFWEAPEVIGHPQTDSPAYGWVEKLKAEGGRLFATFRQRNPDFVEMLKAFSFKHRSVSLAPRPGGGWYLRHVGWLGAAAPAVKGLAAAQFKEGDSVAFEFSIGGDEPMSTEPNTDKAPSWFTAAFQPVLEFIKGEGKKPAPADPPAAGAIVPGSAAFNEAVKAAAKGLVDEATATFSTRIEALETENAGLKTKLDQAAQHSTRAGVDKLIGEAERDGRWVPAFNQDGTREMVYAMAENQPLEFGEAGTDGKRKKLDGIGQVKHYLAKLPKRVQFGELTADAGDNRSAVKQVGFNAPTNGNVVVHNFGLAARANEIEAERKVSPAEALRLARMEATG